MEQALTGKQSKNGISEKDICRKPECGGELRRINDVPVVAGSAGGESYFLYQCKQCGDFVLVGGKYEK